MQNDEILDDWQPETGTAFWQNKLTILTKIRKWAIAAGWIWLLLILWDLQNFGNFLRLNFHFFYISNGISTIFEGVILSRYYQTYTALNAFINDRKAQSWFLFQKNLVLFIQLAAIGLGLAFLRIYLSRWLY
jgi:hypothetical protein